MENNFIEQLNSYSKEALIKFIDSKFPINKDLVIQQLDLIKESLAFNRKMQNEKQAWNDYQKASNDYINFLKSLFTKYGKKEIKLTELTTKELEVLCKLQESEKKTFDKWNKCYK